MTPARYIAGRRYKVPKHQLSNVAKVVWTGPLYTLRNGTSARPRDTSEIPQHVQKRDRGTDDRLRGCRPRRLMLTSLVLNLLCVIVGISMVIFTPPPTGFLQDGGKPWWKSAAATNLTFQGKESFSGAGRRGMGRTVIGVPARRDLARHVVRLPSLRSRWLLPIPVASDPRPQRQRGATGMDGETGPEPQILGKSLWRIFSPKPQRENFGELLCRMSSTFFQAAVEG